MRVSLYGQLGAEMLTQCVILVGGRGTRLGLLTHTVPKPLLPIGQHVFVDYLLGEVARMGFREVVCLAGYRAGVVQRWARSVSNSRIQVKVVVEPEFRGTAGALSGAKDILDDEFLLLNGDSLFDINLLDFITWQPSGDWVGIVALRSMTDSSRYGLVHLEGDMIRAFSERPTIPGPGLINGGIYRLKKKVLDSIISLPNSLERDVFPVLARHGLLCGRAYDRFFLDIGIPEAYEAAQSLLPKMARRPALFLDRDGVINKDIGYAHRSDQIEWIEGIFDAVKAANDAGAYVFAVTNQAGIARGLYDENVVIQLHEWMNWEFRAHGAHVDEFVYCPHHPTVGINAYTRSCKCRKPAPGMLLDLAQRWPVDLSRSLFIGDTDSDLQAADNAGIAGILLNNRSVRLTVDAWISGKSDPQRP
jgi:D-glycero-D-manno-heptose 1,7-bisphosphate phosphatase